MMSIHQIYIAFKVYITSKVSTFKLSTLFIYKYTYVFDNDNNVLNRFIGYIWIVVVYKEIGSP